MTKKPPKPITPESLAECGTENGHQMAVFQWCAMNRATYPMLEMLFAIPNGGWRHKRTAMILKATGSKRGVPDMCLPVPCWGYYGLFVELKPSVDEGSVSDDQEKWIAKLQAQGYACAVAYGWDMARDILVSYLTGNFKTATG